MCTTGDTAHIDMISKFLPHTRQHVDVCVARTWMKNVFSFPVAVNNSTKIGALVFLL